MGLWSSGNWLRSVDTQCATFAPRSPTMGLWSSGYDIALTWRGSPVRATGYARLTRNARLVSRSLVLTKRSQSERKSGQAHSKKEKMAQYQTSSNSARIVIPKFLQLLGLGALFYIGVWINLYLLKVEAVTLISLISISIILVLIIVQTVLSLRKTKKTYLFFRDRVQTDQRFIYYANIQNIEIKQTFADKVFKTGTLMIYPGFKMNYISNYQQIYDYIQKLRQMAVSYRVCRTKTPNKSNPILCLP